MEIRASVPIWNDLSAADLWFEITSGWPVNRPPTRLVARDAQEMRRNDWCAHSVCTPLSLFHLQPPVFHDPQWRGLAPIHDGIEQKPIAVIAHRIREYVLR